MSHDHFHAQAAVAIFALMRLAFLVTLAATITLTVLRIVGLCFGCLMRKTTRPP